MSSWSQEKECCGDRGKRGVEMGLPQYGAARKSVMVRKGHGAFCLLFILALLVGPSEAADKDASTAFRFTLQGLQAVGGFPPPPGWAPYHAPWWGWGSPWWVGWPAWGAPMPFYPSPYLGASAPYPPQSPQLPPQSSSSVYPPQVKPAGRLVILTNPIDAEVYVDGVRLHQQPNLSYEAGLLSGAHQLDIRKEGFKPFSYKVEIPPGGGIVLPVELDKQ